MDKKIKTVAFDLGGVLAYQDLSILTEEERYLLNVYMNRNKENVNREILEYAKSKIAEIYLKIYKLNSSTIKTLDMLKQENIKPSIWTNNIKEINSWFESINLYRYIRREDIINSFYIGADKPNKLFYYKALETLKNMPEDILFLDDNSVNILSARECSINAKEYDMEDDLKETVETEIRKGMK